MKTSSPTSGFTRADFLLSFSIADAPRRERFAALCESEWGGTQVTESAWELATPLSPADLEIALAPHLAPGDHAAFYYLAVTLPAPLGATAAVTPADPPTLPPTPSPPNRRLFRIVIEG